MKKYRELHPIKEGKRKWRYVTTGVIRLRLHGGARNHPNCKLYVGSKMIAEINYGSIYIYPDYAWNGCSPKHYIGWPPFGMWVGTPDFESTILASLGHDVLFQFSLLLQLRMEEANDCFFMWMDYDGMCEDLRDIYHGAVAKWGKKFWGKECNGISVTYI